MKILITIITLLLVSININAQDSLATKDDISEVKGELEGLSETVTDIKNFVDIVRKIKWSGYIQTQYQYTDEAGISSFAGGSFPANVNSRFQVRRGRIKFVYDQELTQYVLQIDITQNGVGIKDAYAMIRDPWIRTFSLTGGVFDRPFGYEISHPSGMRETPERSRLFQTLFPGERELGVKFEANAEEGVMSYINIKAGLFNGVLPNANENDRNKDFIGRAGLKIPFAEQVLALDGGLSLYLGKVTSTSKYVYSFDGQSIIPKYNLDSSTTNVGKNFNRNYYGVDFQLYYDIQEVGGMSIRTEFIRGKQPGTEISNSFYYPTSADKTPKLYNRNFYGWYISYTQNIGLSNQFVIKFDVLDPNADVEGNDIGIVGSYLTVADINYSTLGIGWVYHWDMNVKFMIYYDIVKNETVNAAADGALANFKSDVKDNVLTLRMQYMF